MNGKSSQVAEISHRHTILTTGNIIFSFKIGLVYVGVDQLLYAVHKQRTFHISLQAGIQIMFKCTLVDNQHTQSLSSCLHTYLGSPERI